MAPDQENDSTILFGETIQGLVEIPQIHPAGLIRRHVGDRIAFLDGYVCAPTLFASYRVAVQVMQNGEQPGSKIRAGPELMGSAKRALDAILDEIVRLFRALR